MSKKIADKDSGKIFTGDYLNMGITKRGSNFFSIALIIGLLYGLTAMDFAVTLGKSINWLSIIIGIVVGGFGIYIWFYDRANARKATLYFPLFLACRGIVEIIKNHETLGEDRSRDLLASCAKTLDEIVYTHGSIIHLKRVDALNTFLSLKKAIDETLGFIERRNWAALKSRFKNDEFREVERYTDILLSTCREEVKELKELPEGTNG